MHSSILYTYILYYNLDTHITIVVQFQLNELFSAINSIITVNKILKHGFHHHS